MCRVTGLPFRWVAHSGPRVAVTYGLPRRKWKYTLGSVGALVAVAGTQSIPLSAPPRAETSSSDGKPVAGSRIPGTCGDRRGLVDHGDVGALNHHQCEKHPSQHRFSSVLILF